MEARHTQGERFFDIIKNTGFADTRKLSAKNFEYLFTIPDTGDFFRWFLTNVDETCVLTQEELEKFRQKAAQNQVIYDLDRLDELNTVINPSASTSIDSNSKNYFDKLLDRLDDTNIVESTKTELDDTDDVEKIRRELEMQEKQLQNLDKQLARHKIRKKSLSDKLIAQKAKKNLEESLKCEWNAEFENLKRQSKQSNQNLNKVLHEFQAKFGDDDSLVRNNNLFNASDPSVESRVNEYVHSERDLLKRIRELMNSEIDIGDLDKNGSATDLNNCKSNSHSICCR